MFLTCLASLQVLRERERNHTIGSFVDPGSPLHTFEPPPNSPAEADILDKFVALQSQQAARGDTTQMFAESPV